MSKSHSQYLCQQCGYAQSQWAGRCPSCDTWNSLVESVVTEIPNSKHQILNKSKIFKLSEIKINENQRLKTGESELDGVLGGGMVAGMAVLVAGEPGIGKSTLLTQVTLSMTSPQMTNDKSQITKVLYVCGEESASQVVLRIKRFEVKSDRLKVTSNGFLLFECTDVDEIIQKIESEKPDLVIVDSVQTLTTQDLTGVAGSVGQVRECTQRLVTSVKKLGMPLFLVGHVTKEGTVAGPAALMHIVDTVLWFEGDKSQNLRLLRAVKNRFGPTDEVGVFEMTESGLVGISDPSRLLLAERVKNIPGSVVSVIMEGKRPILAEIQALTCESQLAAPRRVSMGIDFARLQMLVAVLMRRANLHLGGSDIYVNVTGGIKLADRGVDLAICLAIASAFLNKNLAADVAAVGEVGLLGEVRKVSGLDRRVREAKKLGYRVASAESGKTVEAAIKKLIRD